MQLFSSFFIRSTMYLRANFSIVIFITIILLASCRTTIETHAYFKTLSKDTTIAGLVTPGFESKIQKKDVLGITVSSLSSELDIKFNAASTAVFNGSGSLLSTPGYQVNEQGKITLHFIGDVKAEGLTCIELKEKLQKDLLAYLREPVVNVQYLNRKITILGEVQRPQVINLADERISLIDALVVSGDLKEKANRKDIMIIRDSSSVKKIKHINLEDHSVFSSPWYYLQANDIVYVMTDKSDVDKDERRRTLQTTLSLIASGVSMIVIIINALTR